MERRNIVIANKALSRNLKEFILKTFKNIEIVQLNSNLTVNEAEKLIYELTDNTLIFIDPNPLLLAGLAYRSGYGNEDNCLNANGKLVGSDTVIYLVVRENEQYKIVLADWNLTVLSKTNDIRSILNE